MLALYEIPATAGPGGRCRGGVLGSRGSIWSIDSAALGSPTIKDILAPTVSVSDPLSDLSGQIASQCSYSDRLNWRSLRFGQGQHRH